MRFTILAFITIISLQTAACDDRHQSSSPPQRPAPPTSQRTDVPDIKLDIASDISYSTIDSNTIPGIKRSLDIRLSKKVSEDDLRVIALNLKAEDSRDYDRTFIAYYLPGMTVGAGAWATTHFNPDLEIHILGLTSEEEQELATEPIPDSREIIGRWLDETPYLGSRITIFREDGKLYIEQKFTDGSGDKKRLIETKSQRGRRFNTEGGSSYGDHWWVLDTQGNLQIRDNEGLIAILKKIE